VEEDSTSSPVLIREAMQPGFPVDQIRQAEEELVSQSLSSRQVKNSSKLSLSSWIIDVWLENLRKKGNPWSGPSLKPHKSPLRTFGDVLALAMKSYVLDKTSMMKF
jgi:hypothetical protein